MEESSRQSYLQAMGIQTYSLRKSIKTSMEDPIESGSIGSSIESFDSVSDATISDGSIKEPKIDRPIESTPVGSVDISSLSWNELQNQVVNCKACNLCNTRTNTVFGSGNPNADVMVIGDAPGSAEDEQGIPFLGAGGNLLDAMLQSIDLNRSKVFITNNLKCHPTDGHGSLDNEVAACEAYLIRQIELIKPKIILSLGGLSAKNLLKSNEKVGMLRQQKQETVKQKVPVQVSYHPGYLLRKPSEKAKVWEDLKKLKKTMQNLI